MLEIAVVVEAHAPASGEVGTGADALAGAIAASRPVVSDRAAGDRQSRRVSSWLVGQGINDVSEIEETPRITLVFGGGRVKPRSEKPLAIVRVP